MAEPGFFLNFIFFISIHITITFYYYVIISLRLISMLICPDSFDWWIPVFSACLLFLSKTCHRRYCYSNVLSTLHIIVCFTQWYLFLEFPINIVGWVHSSPLLHIGTVPLAPSVGSPGIIFISPVVENRNSRGNSTSASAACGMTQIVQVAIALLCVVLEAISWM
jgi:hypothetical protein